MSIDLDDPVPVWQGSGGGKGLASAILNVTSNIFLLPAIVVALRRRSDLATCIVYTYVFIASNAYHMCRAGLPCFAGLTKHMLADYIFVYAAIVWTLGLIACRRLQEQIVFYLALSGYTTLVVLAQPSAMTLPLLALGIPLASAVFVLIAILRKRTTKKGRKKARSLNWWWLALALGLFLVGSAFMFVVDDGGAYWWSHPLWHMFSMLAIVAAQLAIPGVE